MENTVRFGDSINCIDRCKYICSVARVNYYRNVFLYNEVCFKTTRLLVTSKFRETYKRNTFENVSKVDSKLALRAPLPRAEVIRFGLSFLEGTKSPTSL